MASHGHGRPVPAMASHSRPWQAMPRHGKAWPAMFGFLTFWCFRLLEFRLLVSPREYGSDSVPGYKSGLGHRFRPWLTKHEGPWRAIWGTMAICGRPWSAMAGHGRPRPAMAGHGQSWLAMADHDPAMVPGSWPLAGTGNRTRTGTGSRVLGLETKRKPQARSESDAN